MRQLPAFVLCISLAGAAWSAGGGGGDTEAPRTQADPQYSQAIELIRQHEYAKAIPLLNAYVARAGDSADAQNYLGYASRKSGNLQAAFTHYNKALALNPKHRGAHEYIGEAYLMSDNLPKAEEHLKVLDGLCTFSCEEYRDLKSSIAAYKAKKTATR